MNAHFSVDSLPGVGRGRKKLLEKLAIHTVSDVLMHLPLRFLDRRTLSVISDLRPGAEAMVRGRIISVMRNRSRRGPALTALLNDETGGMRLTFFKGVYPASRLREGMEITACGTVESYRGCNMVHPDILFEDEGREAAEGLGMLPVYGLTAGLNQRFMRKLAEAALCSVQDTMEEVLPCEVLSERGFQGRWSVYRAAHNPQSSHEAEEARRLVALEELYTYRSLLIAVRSRGEEIPAVPLVPLASDTFQAGLPWKLTSAQARVCAEIGEDVALTRPMRRLLQGDVGSGKTAVAAYALLSAALSGRTAVLLAPTEVLAGQHYANMLDLCAAFRVGVMLLTGGTPKRERKETAKLLLEDPARILVGTHAVLEDWVPLEKLSMLVVDEQHRFGVSQREKLFSRVIPRPHGLVMSATPIPRTLSMAFYGDLDVSVLDMMPPGRGRIETVMVASNEKGRVFRFIGERLAKGEGVFLVYPLKESSESIDARDAAGAWQKIVSGPLGRYGAGLLHGSMTASAKLSVTDDFRSGKTGILVSTTVVEVGIDVPRATVMLIANAERFGLSQLHQLRGRVGRGGKDAWCFLVPGESAGRDSLARLAVLTQTADGFRIAEKDLEQRGPGQVLGTAQHGIPSFRVADLSRDRVLVETASILPPLPVERLGTIMSRTIGNHVKAGYPGV